MKIKDITIDEVRQGKNWRFVPPSTGRWFDLPMEEWGPLREGIGFALEDRVVYSGLIAYPSGEVTAIVLWKEVGYSDYGGDYCEYVNGHWHQLGLQPNPDAPIGQEYIANPLPIDPSFSGDEYRQYHREGFLKHAAGL